MEEGRAGEAESATNEVVSEFQREKVPEMEAAAYALIARAQLDQRQYGASQHTAEQASALSAKSQEPFMRLSTAILAARVHSAVGTNTPAQRRVSADALRTLNSTVAQARRFGFLELELEARLAMGEIEMKSGRTDGGSRRLAEVEKTAQAKGYGLIARKAAALKVARSLQQSLLPKTVPDIEGFEIAGWNQAADETGGDYFDWRLVQPGILP